MNHNQKMPALREVPKVTSRLLFELHRATPVPPPPKPAAVDFFKKWSDAAASMLRKLRG